MARAGQDITPEAGYVRATTVDVLAELPPESLFGPHGRAVADVIETARSLTATGAALLASAYDPAAAGIYHAAWLRWTDPSHTPDEPDPPSGCR